MACVRAAEATEIGSWQASETVERLLLCYILCYILAGQLWTDYGDLHEVWFDGGYVTCCVACRVLSYCTLCRACRVLSYVVLRAPLSFLCWRVPLPFLRCAARAASFLATRPASLRGPCRRTAPNEARCRGSRFHHARAHTLFVWIV